MTMNEFLIGWGLFTLIITVGVLLGSTVAAILDRIKHGRSQRED